jgi:hypothetical protein
MGKTALVSCVLAEIERKLLNPDEEQQLLVDLFSVGPEFVGELDAGQVPEGLGKEFDSHGRALISPTQVSVGQAGSQWTIVNAGQRYLIRRENGTLKVYAYLSADGIIYLSARSTGISLERIYADVGRMLGGPVADMLAGHWTNPRMPLRAKVELLLGVTRPPHLYLILLDNMEDKLAGDGTIEEEGLRLFVEGCLTRPSRIRLIVTSRMTVKVSGPLHKMCDIVLDNGIEKEEEGIALLRQLDPQGRFGLRDASLKELRRAFKKTHGIPRALELLATNLHEDPTTNLSELLSEDIFGTEVMARLVARSYEHLKEAERRVIEVMAVYNVPVKFAAISDIVSQAMPDLDTRTCLRNLADNHFVTFDRVSGEYSLHPLDRDYAYHELPETLSPAT